MAASARGIIGLSGIDTRALTALIREKGMPNAVIAHEPSGKFDLDALKKEAREWPGLVGMDLVPMVTSGQRFSWDETPWQWGKGYGRLDKPEFHVVAIDYGIKRNILRLLAERRLQGHGGAGEDLGRGHRSRSIPTACSCPTARAIRRRPGNMRCR